MTQTPRGALTGPRSTPPFGSIYGSAEQPAYITPEGPVWMWRKGQKVRFFTADGVQVGPEQRNVFPAICAAASAGWIDAANPLLGLMCTLEVRGHLKRPSLGPRLPLAGG